VGHGGAVGALDWGWGAAVGAADGEPKPWMMSGEVWWSEQEKLSENSVCKRKSRHARSSRRCSESRLRRGRAGARADSQRRAWRPRRGSGRGGGSVARKEEDSGESCGDGRPESNTWGCREAGGGAGLQRR
jgi:hypothetical protein